MIKNTCLLISKIVKIPSNVYLTGTCMLFCRSMQQLLDYPEDDIEETFCLNFTVGWEHIGQPDYSSSLLFNSCALWFSFLWMNGIRKEPFS